MQNDKIKWEGLDEIQKTLKRLPDLKTQNRAIISAFRVASKPLISSLENNSPYDTGKLSRSHGFKAVKTGAIDFGKVGALKNKGGYTGAWNEDGTDERTTKQGWSTGKVTAMGYFTKSWNSNLATMRTVIGVRVAKIVSNYFKKLHKNK